MNVSQNGELTAPWRIVCRDDRHAASETARMVLDEAIRASGRGFGLGLSGGRIAPVFFAELVRQSGARGNPLGQADFFWADERCVPPTHEESNFRVAKSALLNPLKIPDAQVHRLAGELPTDRGAAQAVQQWRAWLARRGPDRQGLDVVVLGVGEDGHVASLFPENLATDLPAKESFRAVVGPKPPPQRLTMGYPVLWAARLVIVLAAGAGKQRVVTAAIAGREDTPLARVLEGRGGRGVVVVTHEG